jgi:hypothetical protein
LLIQYPVPVLFILLLIACQSKPNVTAVTKGKDSQLSPKLTKPTVRRLWIPEKIEADGRVMEDGHWRYEIDHESSWSN